MRFRIFPYGMVKAVAKNNNPKRELFAKDTIRRFLSDCDIVMLGDSITEAADWQSILPDAKVSNHGIGGDTTQGILGRIDLVLAARPERCFVMAGINDLAHDVPIATVFENYRHIITELRQASIIVYVQSTLYVSKPELLRLNPKVTELNLLLQDYCQKEGVIFIDLNPLLCKDGKLSDKFSRDGVHPNDSGMAVWAQAISRLI